MIKNNIKIAITLIAVLITVVISGGSVNAEDLTFDADTLVTIGSSNYVILNGSYATAPLIVDGAALTLTVTVPALKTFTFTSPSGHALANNQSIAQSCSADTNVITIVGLQTVVVTPNPSSIVCTISGAGVSTGSSSSSTTSVIDTTPPTNTSIVIAGGASSTAFTAVTLTLGAAGASQMMISNDSSFTGAAWETYATSKSWTLTSVNGTKTVYAKFRDTALNVSTAVSDTITYSAGTSVTTPVATTPVAATPTLTLPYANPQTATQTAANRTALLQYITSLLQSRAAATTPSSAAVPSSGSYKQTLIVGAQSNDVSALQEFLKSQGASIYPEGKVTGYFGALTKAAVGRFQLKYGLVSSSSDAGYGVVGPKTRAKINSLLGL